MKRLSLIVIAFLVPVSLFAQKGAQHAWEKIYPQIESNIKAPVFPDREYNIVDFGARPDSHAELAHTAINAAIDKCSEDGGGRVVVPEGIWHTGPLTLKSNVDLHVSEGATLLFSKDTDLYPLVITRWEGIDCYNYQPMIYAYGQSNIALTGKGTIDGNATVEDWWAMSGKAHYGWKEGIVSQKIGRVRLMEWNEAGTPVEERRLGDGFGMRVQLVNFYKCENVLIEDVTMLRSAFWVIHPLMCQNVIVRGVHIQNDGPNGDGCDPESCKNVLIENCYFDTGDDCIAIKSGRNGDGRRWGIASENIIVRNCRMKNGHGGVVVGSEISGGYRNLFVENCVMDSPLLDRVIRIKTNDCRGGVIENIYVRDVAVGQCKEAVLKINLVYEPNEICKRGYNPTVRNVYLERITCRQSKYGVMVTAMERVNRVSNINLSDCEFNGVSSGGNVVSGKAKKINYDNVLINGELVE